MTDAIVQELYDRAKISDTVSRFFMALDRKQWTALRDVIHETFCLDASLLTGKPAQSLPADEFIQQTAARNGGFKGTLHLNTNHVVNITDNEAVVAAYMYAPHWVGETEDDYYMSAGMYDIYLVRTERGWRMTRLVLHIWREEGNAQHVYAVASERLKKGVR